MLRIDRTDPVVTRKFHHVEELADDGRWEEVHHYEEEYPAKRRP